MSALRPFFVVAIPVLVFFGIAVAVNGHYLVALPMRPSLLRWTSASLRPRLGSRVPHDLLS